MATLFSSRSARGGGGGKSSTGDTAGLYWDQAPAALLALRHDSREQQSQALQAANQARQEQQAQDMRKLQAVALAAIHAQDRGDTQQSRAIQTAALAAIRAQEADQTTSSVGSSVQANAQSSKYGRRAEKDATYEAGTAHLSETSNLGMSIGMVTMVGVSASGAGAKELVVKSVQDGGPAKRAGLRVGDIITYVDGVDVNLELPTDRAIIEAAASMIKRCGMVTVSYLRQVQTGSSTDAIDIDDLI